MQVMEVIEAGVDAEARWTKKAGKHQFGYKQHVLVNDDGLVLHVASTPANTHDSKALPQLLERSKLPPNTRVHADKAYTSKFHSELLKSLQLKNGIQDKAVRGKPVERPPAPTQCADYQSEICGGTHLRQSSEMVW